MGRGSGPYLAKLKGGDGMVAATAGGGAYWALHGVGQAGGRTGDSWKAGETRGVRQHLIRRLVTTHPSEEKRRT